MIYVVAMSRIGKILLGVILVVIVVALCVVGGLLSSPKSSARRRRSKRPIKPTPRKPESRRPRKVRRYDPNASRVPGLGTPSNQYGGTRVKTPKSRRKGRH